MATVAVITSMRTSGVAPFSSNFDALASTYDAGDKMSAKFDWTCVGSDGSSLPPMTGPIAHFPFETPSITYTVGLTVEAENGVSDSTSVIITSNPFTGSTRYVSSSLGNDSWDGAYPDNSNGGTKGPWRTWGKAMDDLASLIIGFPAPAPVNRRTLFKRGDTFPVTQSHANLARLRGPCIISAYGSGSKPVINDTRDWKLFTTTLSLGYKFWDCSVVDLEFRATYDKSLWTSPGLAAIRWDPGELMIEVGGVYDRLDLLILRCDIYNYVGFIGASNGAAPPNVGNVYAKMGNVGIVDCVMKYGTVIPFYWFGRDSGIVNTHVEWSGHSHTSRFNGQAKMCIYNSKFLEPCVLDGARHSFKMHADGPGAPSGSSMGACHDIYITACTFRGGQQSVHLTPQDEFPPNEDEELYDIIVDHCTFLRDITTLDPGNKPTIPLYLVGHDIVVRNCVFEMPGLSTPYVPGGTTAICVDDFGGVAPTDEIHLYNNTARCVEGAAPGDAVFLIDRIKAGKKVYIKNNLAHATGGTMSLAKMRTGTVESNIVDDGNVVTPASSTYVLDGVTSISFAAWQALGGGHAANSLNLIGGQPIKPVFQKPEPWNPLVRGDTELAIVAANTPQLPRSRYDWNDIWRNIDPLPGTHQMFELFSAVVGEILNVVECDVASLGKMRVLKALKSYSIPVTALSVTHTLPISKGTRVLRFTAGKPCYFAFGEVATTNSVFVSDSYVDYYLDGNFGATGNLAYISVVQA